ncbi:MAG TPA: hypothetical protein VLQ80_00920 [Candidatus Saccharimonadia bacterium]|nr:hypothetical protein [Candidatus Saccharimonadia bacterium]
MLLLRGIVHVLVFLLGLSLVISTVVSAMRTFVLPRSAPDLLTRAVFGGMRWFFTMRLRRTHTYLERDRVLELYAPLSLLSLPPVWLMLVLGGYMGMYWALGVSSWYEAFRDSGSALLTLGFAPVDGVLTTLLMFSEAILGLLLAALLIAYLPTMYAAFSRRETLVTLLEVRAGSPPSALTMLTRFHLIHGLDHLTDMWEAWEVWFAELAESHTSLAAVAFFRSPQPEHAWITAAGAVLDAAALAQSVVDCPPNPKASLCIRAGYLALRRIADFFSLPYPPDPHFPAQPISISRAEFDAACAELARHDVPLKADWDLAWNDFAGWRVNYDPVLLALCTLTTAPPAPWSSDRAPQLHLPLLQLKRR